MRIVSTQRSRFTGTRVSVVDNRDGGFDDGAGFGEAPRAPEDGSWAVVCEDHSCYALVPTRRHATWFAPYPDNFCADCADLVDGREAREPQFLDS